MLFDVRKLAALIGAITIAGVTAFATAAPAGAAAAAPSPVKIYQVYYNPPGPDTHSNTQLNREYVELGNGGKRSVSLTGWTLRDTAHHVYKFGRFALRAGKVVYIHTGKGHNTTVSLYWGRAWYVWNNAGDTATVRNARGATVDMCHWKGTARGYVFC